jgi:hypothetical protein
MAKAGWLRQGAFGQAKALVRSVKVNKRGWGGVSKILEGAISDRRCGLELLPVEISI